MKRITLLIIIGVAGLLLAGCPSPGTIVESDSNYAYAGVARIPLDDQIYTISGIVDGLPMSMQAPAFASVTVTKGVSRTVMQSAGGKGHLRLQVTASNWSGARPENLVILKTTDTNTIVLLPGDPVTFRCRAQAEAIAPSYTGQKFDPDRAITWELDYCRMLTPVLGHNPPRVITIPDMEDVNKNWNQ